VGLLYLDGYGRNFIFKNAENFKNYFSQRKKKVKQNEESFENVPKYFIL